jgi:hypothetical protein
MIVSFSNGLIFDDNQFDALNHSLFWNADTRDTANFADYDIDLAIAGGVFDGTILDPTGGSVLYISPTDAQMQGVTAALAEDPGTTVFPASLGNALWGFPDSNHWQVVVLKAVETNTRTDNPHYFGQPAFIFSRRRSPTDPAVVTW